MRLLLLMFALVIIHSSSSCKKSRGTMADMHETERMAVIPTANISEPDKEREKHDDLAAREKLEAIASGFMVDAVLAIYAGQHAANPAVKNITRTLAKQSKSFSTRLKELSAQNGFTLPSAIIPAHEKEMETLKGKRKSIFDEAYLNFIVEHVSSRQAAAEYLLEAQSPELSAFLVDYLSSLKDTRSKIKRASARKQ